MNSFFPINDAVKPRDIVTLIIAILIYLVISSVASFAIGFVSWIPVIGWAFRVVSGIIGLYCFIGIIAAIGKYLRVN